MQAKGICAGAQQDPPGKVRTANSDTAALVKLQIAGLANPESLQLQGSQLPTDANLQLHHAGRKRHWGSHQSVKGQRVLQNDITWPIENSNIYMSITTDKLGEHQYNWADI